MSPPARQSWALLSSRVPTHAVASSQQMEGSVEFHQPEPVLERETETQTVPAGAAPDWGWMGLGAGACPTLRGQEGWTGLAFRAPISPASALGCSPRSFTENKVWLLTPLLVRCHHPPGEAAGSDRSLGALGGAPASPCSHPPPRARSRQALP